MTAASDLRQVVSGVETDQQPTPSTSRRVRAVLSDTYAFIRSAEANKAIAAVTVEDLMSEQIKRNGDSDQSGKSQYDPYAYDPENPQAAGEEPEERANFIGGSDTGRATKLDRLMAMKNELDAVIDTVKNMTLAEVADFDEYSDASEDATPTEQEELG